VIDSSPGTGVFVSNITGLSPSTLYYVRSYAITSAGTGYGTQANFTTRPLVTTTAASSIGGGSAIVGGVLTGGSGSWYYGVAYSIASNAPTPTLAQAGQFPATSPITFSVNLTTLTPNTTYYIRGYVTGSGYTVYGPELSFTTLSPTAPIVASATAITGISANTAISGGTITSDGGSSITAKGVCWGVTPSPTIGVGNFTSNGTGSTAFVSNLTGLSGSTVYYVRAYATNAIGTSYSSADVTFTTSPASPYTLGQDVGYGKVGYIAPDGSGFIVSPNIAYTGDWGCNNVNVVGVGTAIGTGQTNTNLIIASCGVNTAAGTAKAYAGGGFNDWYLPSSGEWGQISTQISIYNINTGNSYTSSQYGTNYFYASTYNYNGPSGSSYFSGALRVNGTFMSGGILAIRNFGPAPAVAPTVLSTSEITSATSTGGITGGYISSDGGATVTERGVCYGTTINPDIAGTKTTNGTGMGSFTSTLTGLIAGTPCYVRAYATNSAGTSYGPEINFTPVVPGFPSVTSTAVSAIGATTATSGGNVTSVGGGAVTARGVCWATTSAPELGVGNFTTDGTGLGIFTSSITGLTTGQLYYVRAYATNATGTSYGAQSSFTPYTFATVTTDVISNLAATSATSGGNVTNENGSPVTARGVCYGKTTLPTISDLTVADVPGKGIGTFVSNLTGLTNGTPYYVRAYVTNGAGTAYGTEEVFTPSGPTVPTVTTDQPANGTETTVTSGGNVTNDGGSAIIARGVVYSSTSFPPTLAGPHTSDGSGTGTFTSNITGLTTGNNYTIIAYATNSSGTAYGNEVYYLPVGKPNIGPGMLTYNVPDEFAQIGLNILNDGGSSITACGAVWSTSPNPTVEVNIGMSTEFLAPMPPTAVIQPVVQLTTYYIRAYASNTNGTSYSPEIVFTPGASAIPTITTDPILNKIGAIAEGGATVLSDGGDPIITAGLVWGTSADPTVDLNLGMTTDGFTGQFYSVMTGLTVGTTYHVRGYATNNTGTGYGADLTFTATAATIGQVISGGQLIGTVFSVDGTGEHGLIADSWGFGISTDWGCSTTLVGTGAAMGSGNANTDAIIADISNNICTSTTENGYAVDVVKWWGPDWYLPSKDEFDLLWTNRVAAGLDATLSAAFPFWSSSEVDGTHVWSFDGTNWVDTSLKTELKTPWSIRSF
jgi:hypothetical protein